jgi:predicted metal-dependent enzyme (double-stranded beta helix superfamily)
MTDHSIIKSAMVKIRNIVDSSDLNSNNLGDVENILKQLVESFDFSKYRPAALGEELAYELDVSVNGSAALYLVSDGVEVVSPPHLHTTWAVILGIAGHEINQIYNVLDPVSRTAQLSKVIVVSKDDVITMASDHVHGTVSMRPEATFHLHPYGCSLGLLRPFSKRVYSVVPTNG